MDPILIIGALALLAIVPILIWTFKAGNKKDRVSAADMLGPGGGAALARLVLEPAARAGSPPAVEAGPAGWSAGLGVLRLERLVGMESGEDASRPLA